MVFPVCNAVGLPRPNPRADESNKGRKPPGTMVDACAHMKQTREKAVPRVAPEPHAPVPRLAVPHVSPLMVYAMVRASRVAAILLGPFGPPRLDVVLGYIQGVHQGMVCWVDINEINLADDATRSWIDAQHAQLGRPPGAPVRPGYYLFRDGQVRAYHSGLIDFKRDKLSLGVGIAAVLAGLYWQRPALVDGAFHAASLQASVRVLLAFEAVITGQQPHATHQAPTPLAEGDPIDEVGLAFEVLGLAPSATQDEVKARFRALAKEWHPDRFTNNAPTSAEAGMRMSQINVAYSVICEARGW
jgi:DnaJ domain